MKKAQFFKSTLIHSFLGATLVVAAFSYPYNSAWAAEVTPISEGAAQSSNTVCQYCFSGKVDWSKGDYKGKTSDLEVTLDVKEGKTKGDLKVKLVTEGETKNISLTDLDIKIDDKGNIKIPSLDFEKNELNLNLKLDEKTGKFNGNIKTKWGIGVTNSITGNYTVTSVPEPITIFGTGTAIGFGILFKKKYSKKAEKVGV
jgi:hypothetical protein